MSGDIMNVIPIVPEDEYAHTSQPHPHWWENYHFNGYDPVEKVGITTYTAIKPLLGVREEIITVYSDNPLFFRDEKKLQENVLTSGSLKMEPLELLRKWKICMKDRFFRTEDGVLSHKEDVEFNLHFEADMPAYGFRTERGDRYEQPGSLKGEIHLDGSVITFNGKGIRDHSWEIRYIPSWGEWYALMGYMNPGFVSCAYICAGGKTFCQGWIGRNTYSDILNIQVNPVFSKDIPKECHILVETADETLRIDSHLISFVNIPMGEKKGETKVREMLVNIEGGGYGLLWYAK